MLVNFRFTDDAGIKRRPALVVSSREYHAGRREVIIAAITSHVRDPLLVGDSTLRSWRSSGLVRPSVATSILWTITRGTIGRKLGSVSARDRTGVARSLARALGLAPA